MDAGQCADELDIRVGLLRDYVIKGAPHDKGGKGRPNKFDPAEVLTWMKSEGLTGKVGRPSLTQDSPDLEAARLRKENALAAKYELQVARERGLLVPADDVKRDWTSKVTTAKNKFVGMAAIITPLLEGRDAAERQTIIEGRIYEILTELSQGK